MSSRKTHALMTTVNNSLYNLPAPSNITHMWNMGSMLGACLMLQIATGIFLAMHYTSSIFLAFDCISHIMRDISSGWISRLMHANGASLFFVCLYMHMGRGLYFKSYQLRMTWNMGVFIFLLMMGTAFLGYVLPWGQMSFWGATVITNLVSAIPYLGQHIVEWLWGGFSVNNATLTRFFSLHYLLPFVGSLLILVHLIFLHEEKSNNPLGLNVAHDKIFFFPYFSSKDTTSMILLFFLFLTITYLYPFLLMDPDNFIPANPMVTPTHIQPEWYFLFAYAILRAIPNKLGGVLCLILSILIMLILPFKNNTSQFSKISHMTQSFWWFVSIFLMLTWLGTKSVEPPYTLMSMGMTFLYFSWFFI